MSAPVDDPVPLDQPEQLAALPEVLCVSCLAANAPGVHFCARCGAPISSFATVGPFEHILATGFFYRRLADRRPTRFLFLASWILFLPTILAALLMTYYLLLNIISFGSHRHLVAVLDVLGSSVMLFTLGVAPLVLLARVIRNYRAVSTDDEAASQSVTAFNSQSDGL